LVAIYLGIRPTALLVYPPNLTVMCIFDLACNLSSLASDLAFTSCARVNQNIGGGPSICSFGLRQAIIHSSRHAYALKARDRLSTCCKMKNEQCQWQLKLRTSCRHIYWRTLTLVMLSAGEPVFQSAVERRWTPAGLELASGFDDHQFRPRGHLLTVTEHHVYP
jgi:hypothetical protein